MPSSCSCSAWCCGSPSRGFRASASPAGTRCSARSPRASEAAYDLSLFEKRETRLVLHPSDGTYEFVHPDRPTEEKRALEFGSRLSVTGIRIEGEDRPLDLPTEIRYLPGGRVTSARIFFRDDGGGDAPSQWTLRLSPFDGSMKILEGTVREDG